jgi:hypothetical protein
MSELFSPSQLQYEDRENGDFHDTHAQDDMQDENVQVETIIE